ncbi:MAG: PrsW family intramembrane metalloprotease [Spirochaetaceae bacterium]|nr:PrsW family intramembrane metalloprotease [Spirochaetaceae bacterium]
MFELLAALGLSALPALAIIGYVYRRDRARPEPLGLISRSILFGFLAVIPAALIEIGLGYVLPRGSGLFGAFIEAFLVAGLVEESVKLFFVKRYLFRRPEFDERADGIVYAVCVSLGFAFVEDFLYGYGDFGLLLLRAFTAVPLHAIASGVMGYYIGLAKIEGRGARGGPAAGAWKRGLLWAVLIHGFYDFFLLTRSLAGLLVIPLLLVGAKVLSRLFSRAVAADALDRPPPPYQSPASPLL